MKIVTNWIKIDQNDSRKNNIKIGFIVVASLQQCERPFVIRKWDRSGVQWREHRRRMYSEDTGLTEGARNRRMEANLKILAVNLIWEVKGNQSTFQNKKWHLSIDPKRKIPFNRIFFLSGVFGHWVGSSGSPETPAEDRKSCEKTEKVTRRN